MGSRVFFTFDHANDLSRVSGLLSSFAFRELDARGVWAADAWARLLTLDPTQTRSVIANTVLDSQATVVMIGESTASCPWCRFGIDETLRLGHPMLGVYVGQVRDEEGRTGMNPTNPLPHTAPVYHWQIDNGAENLPVWVRELISRARAGVRNR